MSSITIESIHSGLHTKALADDFYSLSSEELNEKANDMVNAYCMENHLVWHTVSPMRWSFESPEHGMIDDGVIELRNSDSDEPTEFRYVKVDDAKITD